MLWGLRVFLQRGQRPATNADPFDDADAPADTSPFADEAPATPAASSTPRQVEADPFPDSSSDEGDEPPFAHRTGFDLDIMRGDGIFA